MKPLLSVGQSYMALSEGDQKLRDGLIEQAADSYNKAMQLSRTIPEEEAFDHQGFDALCHTGLSGAMVKHKHYKEALASADIALRYFNRRGELNQDEGKYWIDAVRNRADALEGLGRIDDALEAYRIVGEMIAERKAELTNRPEQQRVNEQNISRLLSLVKTVTKPASYKAWWEFWS
ncbi:MAG: DUF3856 domain-containing protein [Chlorobium sp.]|jgi:tetratricopeptide (TPR) repeat protein|nr:MAG: DUF3856 domain-containing protein [Chlorobium sp.]